MEGERQRSDVKKKTKNWFIIILLLIVIAVLGIVIYMLLHKKEEAVDRSASEGLIVDEEDVPEESPTFTTDMNMGWSFPSGGRVSTDAYIGNSEYNEHDVYFEIYLEDEEQTLLYSSPVLPVGTHIKKLKLDKSLPDGTYPAECTFHLLDDDDPDKEISKVSFSVILVFGDGKANQEHQ